MVSDVATSTGSGNVLDAEQLGTMFPMVRGSIMRSQTLLASTAIVLMSLPAGGQEPSHATATFVDVEGTEIGIVSIDQKTPAFPSSAICRA